ncbi:hypothetical protein WJX72_004672 [[Myrmecia] bisecta]|uniref:Cilia-and flagella-associated protein 96 n=1 Tax=[Myrmecia] bisecta TaxID=41462 RepID=A0AAW1Q1N3_9CHLO
MTTTFGSFSEPGYLAPGATYAKGYKNHDDERTKGITFRLGTLHSGKLNDATFSKFVTCNVGDRYEDASTRLEAKKAEAATVKRVTELPFKGPSPMKKSSAPNNGDYYGTIGGKNAYMSQFVEQKLKKGEVKGQPRNMTTNPMKKGGYGFNKTTLSERKGYKGVMGEYEYLADPLDWAKQQAAAHKAPLVTVPFKPPRLDSKGLFGQYTHEVEGQPMTVYGSHKLEGPAFKPTFSGRTGTFNKYPEYMSSPVHQAVRQKHDEENAPPAWKPTKGYNIGATRSIIRMNI